MSHPHDFVQRHIGPRPSDVSEMLGDLGLSSLDELMDKIIPRSIVSQSSFKLPPALTEPQLLSRARSLSRRNKIFKSYLGQGYYGTVTPPVIQRNLIENPGWYTAYTPYQPEIAQGRLEGLLNFQTLVCDLTGMEISNSSLLDEGTAAAEAMHLAHNASDNSKAKRFLVDHKVFPQTLEVLKTRANPLGIEVVVADLETVKPSGDCFGVLMQYPGDDGAIRDFRSVASEAKKAGLITIVTADLLSLALLQPPGEWGVDVVIGSTQRFGVPMGFGGPHAAYFATRNQFKRLLPGRLVGVSKDRKGRPALRLALQTREQHIRREKATSNICTSQVLLANVASMYAVYHGPQGIRKIAEQIHELTRKLATVLRKHGRTPFYRHYFDTLLVSVVDAKSVLEKAWTKSINFRFVSDNYVALSLDETTTTSDLENILSCFDINNVDLDTIEPEPFEGIPENLIRTSSYLTHPIFNSYHSETEMMRYLFRLQNRDLSLNRSMIPLGSCTMKLNSAAEMIPITLPGFSQLHPFAPTWQAEGLLELIRELEGWLCELTGFSAFSLQPNAGSQGEYAGLLVIREYHQRRGQGHRNVCLIPSSAHGTNPASAIMAGYNVVIVNCDAEGNVDLFDLESKAKKHSASLAAMMITYPSTHGVFEEGMVEMASIVHREGGQVYMDGANFNAQVGLCKPAEFGIDVCHLNLHKTFCIPHGGGGPGVGPIGVAEHLKDLLPTHSMNHKAGPTTGISAVSAAPWGSASILPISWSYISLMGTEGLKQATKVALLNANYIAKKLGNEFPVVYRGREGLIAHECIIDLRGFQETAGVTVEDVAKRLMDFGFHAPTMSWPVPGTLMIEPTESESKSELDRFIQAMLKIREEIRAVETGRMDHSNNPLKNAPHSIEDAMMSEWPYAYSRETAFFPLPYVRENKYWPAVNRIDNAYGDRNLFCSCPPIESEANVNDGAAVV